MPTTKIKMLALAVTGRCNFACRYCYAAPLDAQDMSIDTAFKALKLAAQSGENFVLQFTGGEPLLNFPVIKKIAMQVIAQKLPAKMQIQTNCSLMTDGIADFLYEHKIAIGVSLDGRPGVNDFQRIYKDGTGTSQDIVKGLEILKRRNIAVGITCVVTDENVKQLESIIEFAHFLGNVRRIGFDVLRYQGRGCSLKMPCGDDVKNAMQRVINKNDYLQKLTGIKIKLSQQERAIVQKSISYAYDFGHCYAMNGQAAFVAADGSIYACSSFMGEPDFYIGNVEKGIDSLAVNDLKNKIKQSMRFCIDCREFKACGGGCYARWYGSGQATNCSAECALKLSFI